jgi:hypothetical protein
VQHHFSENGQEILNIFTQPFNTTAEGSVGSPTADNQFIFQSSSASISNMIKAAHQSSHND